jgi:hypothetical protein
MCLLQTVSRAEQRQFLGKVDGDKVDTGLHQRGDEVDVAGEAIELGNDEASADSNGIVYLMKC